MDRNNWQQHYQQQQDYLHHHHPSNGGVEPQESDRYRDMSSKIASSPSAHASSVAAAGGPGAAGTGAATAAAASHHEYGSSPASYQHQHHPATNAHSTYIPFVMPSWAPPDRATMDAYAQWQQQHSSAFYAAYGQPQQQQQQQQQTQQQQQQQQHHHHQQQPPQQHHHLGQQQHQSLPSIQHHQMYSNEHGRLSSNTFNDSHHYQYNGLQVRGGYAPPTLQQFGVLDLANGSKYHTDTNGHGSSARPSTATPPYESAQNDAGETFDRLSRSAPASGSLLNRFPGAATSAADNDGDSEYAGGPARKKRNPPKDAAARKYVCEECSQRFARPSALATHILTHTKEKPFKCLTCDRAFGVMSNLRRHCRVRNHVPAEKPPPLPSQQGAIMRSRAAT